MSKYLLLIRTSLVFISAFFYASNFSYFLSSAVDSLRAWHIYLVLIVASIAAHLFSGEVLRLGRLKLRYIAWCAALMGLCLISLVLHGMSSIAIETMIRYAWVALGSSSFVLLVNSKRDLGVAGMAVIAAVCLVCGVTLLEFLLEDFVVLENMKFDENLVTEGLRRSGGLFINPNANAYAMVFGMCIGISFLPAKLRLIFALFVGVAVFATFSRSGIIMWAVAVIATGLLGQFTSYRATLNVFAVVLILALGYLVVTGQAQKTIESSVLDFSNHSQLLERVSGNFLSQEDDSSISRKQMITDGLNVFYNNPLLGDGLGSSRQFGDDGITGPHNMWLVFGIEFGALGIALLLALSIHVVLAHNGFTMLLGALYLGASAFSHNLLDDMFSAVLLPMGLALIPLFQNPNRNLRRRRRRAR